jgi:hypothetical protein
LPLVASALVCFGTRSPRTGALSKGGAIELGGRRRAGSDAFSLGSQGFHLLTAHLPKPRVASGNISGRMM